MWWAKCVFIFVAILSSSEAARILGFFTAPSVSHFVVHRAVMKELLARGHNITIVTTEHLKISDPSPNYREIFLDNMKNHDPMVILTQGAVEGNGTAKSQQPQAGWGVPGFAFLSHMAVRSRFAVLHEKTQALLNNPNEKFDLFVLGWTANDFQLGIAGHYRIPTVVVSTFTPLKCKRDFVGNPATISTVPMMTTGQPHEAMGFLLRLKTFIFYAAEFLLVTWLNEFKHKPNYNELFPADKGYPSFDEVKRNVSLVLVNHHFSLGGIRPMMPNFIEVSGLQAKGKPDPLPVHLQKFLDGAEHGAIFFSLGSNIKSTNIDESRVDALLKTFGKLKQRVLWKWDVELLNVPENVIVSKWLPQNDILAHKNVRLFISHCGLGSVNEAKFHGVPILAIPFFTDQPGNAKAIVDEGWATLFAYSNITEASMTAAINEMIDNPSYRNKVQRVSQLYRDRPVAPMDLAMYWIEYVLRYDGAKHMQSTAVHLNFFQEQSLDVIAFLLVFLYLAYKFVAFVAKKLYRIITSPYLHKVKTK